MIRPGLILASALLALAATLEGQEPGQVLLDDFLREDVQTEWSIEELQWLEEHPVDLNRAKAGQLAALPLVSPVDAARVVRHRMDNGPFRSIEEIRGVAGLSDYAMVSLYRFSMVPPTGEKRTPLSIELRLRASRVLNEAPERSPGSYLGAPEKLYGRAIAETGIGLSSGLLVEKDAGEPVSARFLSGYLSYRRPAGTSFIIAGDYRFESGLGLVLWNGGGFGGGDPTVSPNRAGRGLVPHRSSDEYGFFRGAGAGISFGEADLSFTLQGFVSRRALDGSPDADLFSGSPDRTGLFRTPGEMRRKGTLREEVVGGAIGVRSGDIVTAGAAAYRSLLFHTAGGSAEERLIAGCYTGLNFVTAGFFGEAAVSGAGAGAFLAGMEWRVPRSASFAVSFRNYGPGFLNNHASGPGVRTDTRNETGWRFGGQITPTRNVRWAIGLDVVRLPERTGTTTVGSTRSFFLSRVDLKLSTRTTVSVQYQTGMNEADGTGEDAGGRLVRTLPRERVGKGRITFTHQPHPSIRFRSRLEQVDLPGTPDHPAERGILLYQEFRLALPSGFSVEGRVTLFRTDSYRSRVYVYENDLRGAFSVPALSGTGIRWYVLALYQIAAGTRLSVRYAETQLEWGGEGPYSGSTAGLGSIQIDVRM